MNRYQQIAAALLRDELAEPVRAQLTALSAVDWHLVIEAAESQGIAPLLLGAVERLKVEAPAGIRAELLEILRNNTARNLQLLGEFTALARALQSQDIAFLPLKGVHLCSSLYENLGERAIWDIDLMVPVPELGRALEAIETTGYRASRPYDPDLERKNFHHLPLYIKPGAPPLEIHWTLLNPRFGHELDWASLWARSIPGRIGNVDVRVLSPADLIIYLCAHVAYQHVYMDSVRSLYDIKLAVRRLSDQLDWTLLAERCRAWGLLSSVYLTLRLTDELLGCPLPDALWQRLRPPDFVESLVQAARVRMFDDRASPVISAVWARRSLPERLWGLWQRLAVSRSILAGTYGLPPNSRKVYVYYLVRLVDLLRVHGRGLLDLLFGGRAKKELARRDSELIAYLNWWQ